MAAAYFNHFAAPGQAHAVSAGTQPAEKLHPVVVDVMLEAEIDLRQSRPQMLTTELVEDAQLLITMGCGDQCPYVPGLQREDWPLRDPKGLPIEEVRVIRDEVRERVRQLLRTQT